MPFWAPFGRIVKRMNRVGPSRVALPRDFNGTRHPDLLRLHHPEGRQHLVQFYEDYGVIVDNVGFLAKTALEDGDCAIIIGTAVHRDQIRNRLAEAGLNIEGLLATRHLVMLDAAETLSQFMLGNRPDAVRFDQVVGKVVRNAIARSANGFAFGFGEMVALLCGEGKPEGAIGLEQLWNALWAEHNFSLYCAYSFDCLRSGPLTETVLGICNEHGLTI
jgi:hypothetical protein